MLMDEVRARAKVFGVKTARTKKIEIIRAIQSAEGNFPCFGTSDGYCDQACCCFRQDCLEKKY
ncbi:MAG: SAP domain-containing protein [Deltaproteobacteria bacterium]|nr:SAP domain-containing protein [Deltaproteobacteria bacterium]